VSTTEELLGRKNNSSGLENREYGRRFTDHVAASSRKKLALTERTSGGRSVGIVRSQIQATELIIVLNYRAIG
jgi:hypothetical protein